MIRIDKWVGLVTNASQYAIPPGASVEQVNVQCIAPGQLTVRSGMETLAIPSGASPTASIVRAVRYEHGAGEQVVFQDSEGHIFSSTVAASPPVSSEARPGKPSIQTVVPGSKSLAITVAAATGTVAGYAFQLSTDGGKTWSGAGSSTGTAYTISDLLNGTAYYVRAAASSASGLGDYSESFGPVSPSASSAVAASAPPLVTASASGALAASVVWQRPSSDGGAAITGYRIQASADSGTTWTTVSSPVASAVSATVNGLSAGTTYVFRVAAVTSYGVGQNSANSNAVVISSASSAPSVPRTPSGTATTTTIVLTWLPPDTPGTSAVTGYSLKLSGGGSQLTATTTSTSYTFSGLTAGTAYTISIAATSAAGTGAWATLPAITTQSSAANTAPSAVIGLSLTRSASGFTATWSVPTSNGGASITGYTLSTATAPEGPYTVRYQNTATTATVTGLVAGTTYYVRVVANNSVGSSSPVQDTVMPGQAPSAPQSVAVSFYSASSSVLAKVTWTAPVNLYGLPILYYRVTTTQASSTQTQDIAGNVTTADVPVTIGLEYTWSVRAVTALGDSTDATVTRTVTDPNAKPTPSEPLAVVVTPGNASATVTWDPPALPGTSAILSYRITITGRTAISVQASAARSYTFTALTNGTSYIVTIAAVNLSGVGATATAPPVIPFTLASAPTGTVLNLGSGYWLLRWTPPASTGGLAILRYGIRTNVGTSGPFGGGAGLVAETSGVPVAGTTQLSYLYKSPLRAAYASDGSTAGRFDVYAITSAGSGVLLSLNVTLPENDTPPVMTRAGIQVRATDRGRIEGTASTSVASTTYAVWRTTAFELQYSYDNIAYYDLPAIAVTPSMVSVASLFTNTTAQFSFRIPYNPTFDPSQRRSYRIWLRVKGAFVNAFSADVPYSPTAWYTLTPTVYYAAPAAPTPASGVASTDRTSVAATWQATEDDGGAPVTSYSLQSQNTTTCAISTQPISVGTLSSNIPWAGTSTLRWRIGATNVVGTTYSPWQNTLADGEVLVGTYTVPGTSGYVAAPLDTGLVATYKFRLLADGAVTVSAGTTTGPGGLSYADGTGKNPGALLRSFDGTTWTQHGSCGLVDPTGTGGRLYLSVYDDSPSDNSGSYSVAVVAIDRAISAPRAPSVNVNGSTVYVRCLAPANTQGLTVTKYRLQSSLDNSSWTTVAESNAQFNAGVLLGPNFVAENQPSGTVYYRITALAGTTESTPAFITKNDITPSAPPGLSASGTGSVASVSWLAPAYDGGLPVTQYVVEKAEVPYSVTTISEGYWRIEPQSRLQPPLTASVGFGQWGTVRCMIRVKAVNARGSSPYTTVVYA